MTGQDRVEAVAAALRGHFPDAPGSMIEECARSIVAAAEPEPTRASPCSIVDPDGTALTLEPKRRLNRGSGSGPGGDEVRWRPVAGHERRALKEFAEAPSDVAFTLGLPVGIVRLVHLNAALEGVWNGSDALPVEVARDIARRLAQAPRLPRGGWLEFVVLVVIGRLSGRLPRPYHNARRDEPAPTELWAVASAVAIAVGRPIAKSRKWPTSWVAAARAVAGVARAPDAPGRSATAMARALGLADENF